MQPLEDKEIDQATIEAEEALRLAEEEMEQFVRNQTTEELEQAQKELEEKFPSFQKPTDQPTQKESIEEKYEAAVEKSFTNLEDLSFVRLIDPVHIPSYLVEQIKNRLFSVEKFYDYLKILCTFKTENGPILNATVYLYAISNVKLRQVKGFLFMYVDVLTNSLIISQFSIDKEYWNKGEAVVFMLSYAKQLMKELSLSRILWLTKNVKTCESLGFDRSRETLMNFEGK